MRTTTFFKTNMLVMGLLSLLSSNSGCNKDESLGVSASNLGGICAGEYVDLNQSEEIFVLLSKAQKRNLEFYNGGDYYIHDMDVPPKNHKVFKYKNKKGVISYVIYAPAFFGNDLDPRYYHYSCTGKSLRPAFVDLNDLVGYSVLETWEVSEDEATLTLLD